MSAFFDSGLADIQLPHAKLKFATTPFQIKESEVHLISGENGIGKSQWLKFLHQKLQSEQGLESVAYAHQFPLRPLANLRVSDYLQFLRQRKGFVPSDLELFENLFTLQDLSSRPISKLSGGQNQLLKLLGTLLLRRPINLWDEPDQFLDAKKWEKILEVVEGRKQKNKDSFIMVAHHTHLFGSIVDQSWQMSAKGNKDIQLHLL